MLRFTKLAVLGVSVACASLAAGCATDYYGGDGYNHHRYYRDRDDDGRYYDRDRNDDRYRDRDRYDDGARDADHPGRHWVCDSDGDDCHWSR